MGIKKIKRAIVSNLFEPKRLDRMKLGASYSVWNGEELLESSLRNIRPMVDYINVVWQRLSWHGNEANPSLEDTLNKICDKGLCDKLIFFEPDLTKSPSRNETAKRNIGLLDCQKNRCSHFLTMDVDEFYDPEKFTNAKKFILENNITHSACNIAIYVNTFVRHRDYSMHGAPFIYRIDNNEKLVRTAYDQSNHKVLWRVDATRQIPIKWSSRVFFFADVVMHHYHLYRKDLDNKYSNCGLSDEIRRKYLDNAIKTIESVKDKTNMEGFISVENTFGLPVTL